MTAPTSFETFRKALEIDAATVASAKDLHERARKALEDLPGFERSFLSGSYARNALAKAFEVSPQTACHKAPRASCPSDPGGGSC